MKNNRCLRLHSVYDGILRNMCLRLHSVYDGILRKCHEKKGSFQKIGFSLFLCPTDSYYFTDNCPNIQSNSTTNTRL